MRNDLINYDERATRRLTNENYQLLTNIAGRGSKLWWWPDDLQRRIGISEDWGWTVINPNSRRPAADGLGFYFTNANHAAYFKLLFA